MNAKNISIAFFTIVLLFGVFSFNSSYSNCMEATKHSYISEKGANHIAAQCQSFIKDKSMVK
tara:strand:+ start:297 stop:482 length:186 start_codon:yes stop_codon:yes gene_type:complete